MSTYAHSNVLVDTDWVAQHLDNSKLRLIEADVNTAAYDSGHIPSAAFWNVLSTIVLPDFRTNLDKTAIEQLLSQAGVANDTTIIIYSTLPSVGPWLFWFLKLFGHDDVRLLNGGRKKWVAEGRPLTTDSPTIIPTHYVANTPDPKLRAVREDVQMAIASPNRIIVDVRTPQEYSGALFFQKPPEGTERAGHIPGAVSIPYDRALNDDGTFKSASTLAGLYNAQGITADKDIITHCTFGGRSSHTWFVLKYLLGYTDTRNYDAGWLEWGKLPDTPVEQ